MSDDNGYFVTPDGGKKSKKEDDSNMLEIPEFLAQVHGPSTEDQPSGEGFVVAKQNWKNWLNSEDFVYFKNVLSGENLAFDFFVRLFGNSLPCRARTGKSATDLEKCLQSKELL